LPAGYKFQLNSLDYARVWFRCLTIFLASAAAAQFLTVHISDHDQAQIYGAIRAATREPILGLIAIYERNRVPESIPVKQVEAGPFKNGKIQLKPVIVYERTDRVVVRTGSEGNAKGDTYIAQRVGTTWKVAHKSSWIH
jgi:hypothetical protein